MELLDYLENLQLSNSLSILSCCVYCIGLTTVDNYFLTPIDKKRYFSIRKKEFTFCQ